MIGASVEDHRWIIAHPGDRDTLPAPDPPRVHPFQKIAGGGTG